MGRTMRCALGALVVMGLAAPGVRAQGIDTTCVLPLTKTDPATVNAAYPDEAAIYFIGAYQALPGTRLRITGQYPHSRYFSFNVYDQAQRPLDALADVEIQPDAGAVNPFVAGARRDDPERGYTAWVDFGPKPDVRAPNTLYTGTGQTPLPNENGTFIFRVYIPDTGRDETGGVGLPTVTLEPSGSDTRPAQSACAALSKPAVAGPNEAIKAASGPPLPAGASLQGNNPVHWVKFKNLVQALNRNITDSPFLDVFTQPASAAEPVGGSGAFLSNIHNSYVFTAVNRSFGEVSVTRFRAPSTPDTRAGTPVMPAAQLRYFSMCTNDAPSQRFIACATDDQTAIGADGFAEYVVSSTASRPRWATSDCGYTWLPQGPAASAVLILRHMLPDPAFAQSIQRATPGDEVRTMGDTFPVTSYLPAGADRPCRAQRVSTGPSLGLPASTPAKRCTSRRAFTIHLARTLRSATITVAGRKAITVRGARLRARIVLRGLPRGSYRVRIVGRTRAGKTVTSVRTYRTCVARSAAPRSLR